MADNDAVKIAKDYHLDAPFAGQGNFHVKGAANLSWGMKRHLSQIFHPKTGNTVMFAFDHGYFMGATSGLERLDLVVPPLLDYVDVMMCTKGALQTCVSPASRKGLALRVTSGSSMLDADLSHEVVSVDIDEVIRLGANCMAVQTFIGATGQLGSLDNLFQVVSAGARYDIPTLGVVAVGKDMDRTDRFFKLATRMLAELGANMVKTYYCDNFEEVAAACPVPLVVAGGKKLPEAEALTLAYRSMQSGARGVDMGRNIFQSTHPVAMIQAVRKVVHEGFTDKEAYQYFQELASAT